MWLGWGEFGIASISQQFQEFILQRDERHARLCLYQINHCSIAHHCKWLKAIYMPTVGDLSNKILVDPVEYYVSIQKNEAAWCVKIWTVSKW
jgi:hypothetical protein